MSNLLNRKSVTQVSDYLRSIDKNYNLIVLDETARTAKDAAKSLNKKVGAIIKSLLFKDLDNNFHLCLVSGDKLVSLEKISKIFNSLTVKAKLPPFVPTPAPALISPVGCSSTVISKTFKFGLDPSEILDVTVLKIFLDLILATDLSKASLV